MDPTRIATLPKVELHVHLEGTISASTAAGLARARGEDPTSVLVLADGPGEADVADGPGATGTAPRYPHPFRDFLHFVDTFLAASGQVRTPADLTTVVTAFAAAQAAQRVRWTEATFTAVTMEQRGWEPAAMWDAVAEGLAEGLAAGPDAHVGLILDTPRDLGVDLARRNVELARSALDAGLPVVALGLTGVEGAVHVGEFAFLRAAADELGIGLVPHAGEMGGPDVVADSLDLLRPDRIGHGIATASDPALLARVAEEGVVLEVCQSSNVTLGLVPSLDAHPIRTLRDAGVAITINSDDPPFFATTLTDELAHAVRLLELDASRLAALQRRAVDASFAPAELRAAVHAELDVWLREG